MIPVLDLRRQYASLKGELDEAVGQVLASGQFILGPQVEALEEELAAYLGVLQDSPDAGAAGLERGGAAPALHAVAVASGTDALRLSLLAAGLEPGDEVITVACTAYATVAAILAAGGKPVLVDVDAATYTMDPAPAAAAVTPRTRAIIPVHLYGHPADMDPLIALARRHGLLVIEDAAQAHGARYRGQRVGALGALGCFSFYPTKNLGAYGDGGLVVTADGALAGRLRLLRNQGQEERFHHSIATTHSRLDDLQAAILRVKLRHLEEWNARRRELAAFYRRELSHERSPRNRRFRGVPQEEELVLPTEAPWASHVYHLYVVQAEEREALRRRLAERGVATDVHYPIPNHLQPAFASLGYREGAFPVSEALARRAVTLPLFPELTEAEARQVAGAVRLALTAPEANV